MSADVTAREVSKSLGISRTTAYVLMHELGAKHVRAGAHSSLRLDRVVWVKYLLALCGSSHDTASTARSATTPTPTPANDVECFEPQASVSTARPKPSARPNTSGAKKRPHSTGPKVSPGLAKAVERARQPSHTPLLRTLRESVLKRAARDR